jgi:putative ABC transport system permease protein
MRRFFRIPRHDPVSELDAEIAFHIEAHAEDLVRRGIPRDQALRSAHAAFGNRRHWSDTTLTIDRQFARETRMRQLLQSTVSDVAFAIRGFRRTPAFTIVALLTLGLGIGATVAVFSAVSGVILRPLPWPAADRIVHLGERGIAESGAGQNTSSENAFDWQRMSRSFEAMGLYTTFSVTYTGGSAPLRVDVANVTPGMFDVFRVVPALGRTIAATDTVQGAPTVAVVSWDFWKSRLGGGDIVGRTIQLNFNPVTVVGILPRDFRGPQRLDRPIWLNFVYDTSDGRGGRSKNVFALLRPGVSVAQAQHEMTRIARQLAELHPRYNKGSTVVVDRVADVVIGQVDRPLYLLLGASALVLLIACANISNLLVVRGIGRQRELAVRTALGAGGQRLARQLLVESMVLAGAGSALGVLLGWWATRTIAMLGPDVFRDRPPSVDERVLAFSVALAVLSTIIFGLAPALRAARADVATALRAGGRVIGLGTRRARATLALVQLALAVVLLTSCGLVLKSFARVLQVDPGVQVDDRLYADLWLPRARYDSGRSVIFYQELERRLLATPGVRHVGLTSQVPLSGYLDRVSISQIAGRPELTGADMPEGDRYIVSPGYLGAMGIRVLQGRGLLESDRYENEPVALVDEAFARKAFGDADPIGQRMKLPARPEMATVVGVVSHVKTYGLDTGSPGQIYMSNAQYRWRWLAVVVHTSSRAESFAPTLARVVQSIDPDQPIAGATTLESALSTLLRARQLTLTLLGAFALIALVLASVGLYGVIAYSVSQRRAEFGVRMALGAPARAVGRMIVSEGGRIAVAGLVVGILGALLAGRLLASLLYEVRPTDPLVFATVATLLLCVALLASIFPARRAMRVSPSEVLRQD